MQPIEWGDIEKIVRSTQFLGALATAIDETSTQGIETGFNVIYEGEPVVSQLYRGSKNEITLPYKESDRAPHLKVHTHPSGNAEPSYADLLGCTRGYNGGGRGMSYEGMAALNQNILDLFVLRSENGVAPTEAEWEKIKFRSYGYLLREFRQVVREEIQLLHSSVDELARQVATTKSFFKSIEARDILHNKADIFRDSSVEAIIPSLDRVADEISKTGYFTTRVFHINYPINP